MNAAENQTDPIESTIYIIEPIEKVSVHNQSLDEEDPVPFFGSGSKDDEKEVSNEIALL
jgi:hypothetical protein